MSSESKHVVFSRNVLKNQVSPLVLDLFDVIVIRKKTFIQNDNLVDYLSWYGTVMKLKE